MKRLFFLVMVFLVIIGLLSCTGTTTKFILNLVSNPLIGGIVQGQGEYEADEEINITAIPNEGYDFINWTNEDDDVISTLAAFLFIMPSNDATLTANFILKTYTVTFDNNGGDTQADPQTIDVYHGNSVNSLPFPPTKINHGFLGWNTQADGNGDEFTEDTIVTDDTTVYAKWGIDMYTVTFDNNGGDTQANPQTIAVEHGGSIDSLPVPPTRIGHTFVEWNIEQDGSGDEFTVDTIVENDITVYAQWAINQYTVTTEVVPAGSGNVIGAGDYNYDSQVELTANPNVDHDFVRWVDEDDNELSTNNPYIFSMPANDIHVKAVFREFEVGEKANYKIGVIDFNMVFAPAAVFPIGGGVGSFSRPLGQEEVENSFWIGETTVTYELWYTVRKWAEDNGYTFANEGREGSMGVDGAAPTTNRNHPVTRVSWRDVIVWCNALSERMNLDPLYRYFDGIDHLGRLRFLVIKDSTDDEKCDISFSFLVGNGFRLPTIWEWELAARYIGPEQPTQTPLKDEALYRVDNYWTPGDYASGAYDNHEDSAQTQNVAWHSDNSAGKTNSVKLLRPNQLGVYDMSGNVWEWCEDKHPDLDPLLNLRTVRGGSYSNAKSFMQIDLIVEYAAGNKWQNAGFRLVKNTK